MTREPERGARLLDAKRKGWASSIELSMLDMSSLENDVLTQLYGDFLAGLEELGIVGRAAEYGFALDWPSVGNDSDWQELTKAWVLEIGRRLYK